MAAGKRNPNESFKDYRARLKHLQLQDKFETANPGFLYVSIKPATTGIFSKMLSSGPAIRVPGKDGKDNEYVPLREALKTVEQNI